MSIIDFKNGSSITFMGEVKDNIRSSSKSVISIDTNDGESHLIIMLHDSKVTDEYGEVMGANDDNSFLCRMSDGEIRNIFL